MIFISRIFVAKPFMIVLGKCEQLPASVFVSTWTETLLANFRNRWTKTKEETGK